MSSGTDGGSVVEVRLRVLTFVRTIMRDDGDAGLPVVGHPDLVVYRPAEGGKMCRSGVADRDVAREVVTSHLV